MLTSCSYGTPATVVQPHPSIYVSPLLQEPCEPLPILDDGKQSTLLSNHIDTARLYHLCKQRHSGLVKSIMSQQGVASNK